MFSSAWLGLRPVLLPHECRQEAGEAVSKTDPERRFILFVFSGSRTTSLSVLSLASSVLSVYKIVLWNWDSIEEPWNRTVDAFRRDWPGMASRPNSTMGVSWPFQGKLTLNSLVEREFGPFHANN